MDDGPEFVSNALDQWAYLDRVTLDFSQPGNPTGNAFVESFNGNLRDECLHLSWFLSRQNDRGKIEAWGRHYNESCTHTALGGMPPTEFASKVGASSTLAGSTRPGNFTPQLDPKRGTFSA